MTLGRAAVTAVTLAALVGSGFCLGCRASPSAPLVSEPGEPPPLPPSAGTPLGQQALARQVLVDHGVDLDTGQVRASDPGTPKLADPKPGQPLPTEQ
jgi:hypothetical protein